MKPIAIYTTVGSLAEARAMAQALVEQKLVACAQIEAIESFYPWQGAMQNDQEFRLLLKSTEAHYPAVEAAIRALHSYELPAIYAQEIAHIYAPYAAWIDESTRD